ncbi:MAG: lipoyl(octanoyl) transferase, partial [Gaiellales bacterium]|nr:lipoyl(octanoyl) transferase [Gaiellales bacterium]
MSDETHHAYVYDLLAGPRSFGEVDRLQLELSAARSQHAIPDTIVLCEHPPTLTLGRASDAEAELPAGEAAYRALGWDVVRANRGGRSTWHGPGQLVCYPILDLRDHGKDLRRYAHDLEQVVIESLAAFGIAALAGEDREHVG